VTARDQGVDARLGAMVQQAFNEAHGRGTVSGIGAGLRSWSNTSRGGAEAAVSATAKAVIVTTLIAIPVVAASIASFGTLPIAAAVIAIAGLAASKVYTVVRHSSDVTAILDRAKKGENLDQGIALRWERVKPDGLSDETVEIAEKIFTKLISDVKKLRDELDEFIESVHKSASSTRWSHTAAVGYLLKAEAEIHRDGSHTPGKGAKWGKGNFISWAIYPLSTKSGDIPAKSHVPLHRLRRIRYYLRWMREYMILLEQAAAEAVSAANTVEEVLLAVALRQVVMEGNHGSCGNVCFRARTQDIQEPPPSARQTGAGPAPQAGVFGLTTGVDADWAYTSAADRAGYLRAGREAVAGQVVGAATAPAQEALTGQLAQTVASGLGEAAGAAALGMFGTLIGDAISFATKEAFKRYHSTRPLQGRARMIQEAMRENDGGTLDAKVAELAGQNDVEAVLTSFLLAHSHYPTRVKERMDKLSGLVNALPNVSGPGAPYSPFTDCRHAATAFRYLAKVYHQAEKMRIHILFVGFALDAIDQKIFREGYRVVMKPALEEIKGFDKSKLVHVRTKAVDVVEEGRMNTRRRRGEISVAAAQAASVQRGRLEARKRDHEAAVRQRDHEAALRVLEATVAEAHQLLGATYVNAAPYLGGTPGNEPRPAQLATAALTMDEWRTVSSVFMKPRADLTKRLDSALEPYLNQLTAMMSRARNQSPGAPTAASAQETIRQLRARAQLAEGGVRRSLREWLDTKKEKPTSGRRPSIVQLQVIVETEIAEFNRMARECESALQGLG
jgi:hypothetical protein